MEQMRPYSQTLDRLRDAGLRPTRQRLALGKLLFDTAHRHITAEQLHSEAMTDNIRVSLATVYNTLHQFTDAGLLREIVVDAGRSYFDTNTDHHHHFFDETNGTLIDVPKGQLNITDMPTPPVGATIESVDVVVHIRTAS